MFLTQISSDHTVLSSEHCICMTGKRRRAVTALAELSISHRSVITAAFSNLIYHWSIKIKSLMAKVIFSMDVFPLYLWIIWDLYLSRVVPARWPPPTTSRASFTQFWKMTSFTLFFLSLQNHNDQHLPHELNMTMGRVTMSRNTAGSRSDDRLGLLVWQLKRGRQPGNTLLGSTLSLFFPPFRSISFYFFPTCILTSF